MKASDTDRISLAVSRIRIFALASSISAAMLVTACSGGTAGNVASNSPSPSTAVSSEIPAASPSDTASSAPTEDWKLVWSDEFDGADGSVVDPNKWVMEKGNNNGWGNSELEYYTDSTDNCSIQGGNLVIKAIKEDKEGFQYTSSRIITKGKFDFQYGKVEMKAKLPYGKGIWPAFWMLGSNIDSVGWPKCGEVDIMEFIGRTPDKIYGTLHGPEYNGANGIGRNITAKGDLSNDYHTYAVEWDKDAIKWYFDGEMYHQVIRANLPKSYTWVYDQNFFIILNLAVGGNWPQKPDSTTQFPQSYTIDYVRVYQK